MRKPEGKITHARLLATLALSGTAVAAAVALTLPATLAHAQPAPDNTTAPAPPADPNAPPPPPPPPPADPNLLPPPPPPPADPFAPPPPPDPFAPPPPADPFAPPPPPPDPFAPPPPPPPPPADPNAPPPPVDPNAPPPPAENRVEVPAGGFSYLVPPGWTVGDATRVSYGQAVLTKTPPPGQPVATDTSILLGRLDLKLFAGAEQDNQKAAVRLASDMGEFYMPFPGTRIDQEVIPLDAAGVPGFASYYEVKFTDTNKPDGQIWAAAIGSVTPRQGVQEAVNERWFVVWLGSSANPVNKDEAKALAESIRLFVPPPPPPADPNAPPPPLDPNAPPPPPGVGPGVGVPRPVNPEDVPPEMLPPA